MEHTASEPAVDEPQAPFNTCAAIVETRLKHAYTAWTTFAGTREPPLLFYGGMDKVAQMSPEVFGEASNWFILGDIHGDYYALRNAVEHIKRLCPDFRLVFLGDLVDRGPHPMECLWYLLALAHEYPQRVLWIAGNHDVGVSFDMARDRFHSTVSPSEFLDHLNQLDSWSPFRRKFGHEFIELVAGLPRAVLCPDGLLITHGGIPHTDLHTAVQECENVDDKRAWLNSPQALQDFTWTRISRYRRKIPNRNSTGCSYGFEDFDAFCEAVQDFFPAARLVTGHDHPEGGVDTHEEWQSRPALTLTGFGFADDYEHPAAFNERYREHLLVGRCRKDEIPEVIRIPVMREDLQAYFKAEVGPLFPSQDMPPLRHDQPKTLA
jgi:hypothetical protein